MAGGAGVEGLVAACTGGKIFRAFVARRERLRQGEVRTNRKHKCGDQYRELRETLSLPPPLRGKGGEGGSRLSLGRHTDRTTRTPNPSPQGGGEHTECAAAPYHHARKRQTAVTARHHPTSTAIRCIALPP